mgnify:CR=1 FL=1
MAHSSLVREVAAAINEVMGVISWTLITSLPVIIAIFISVISLILFLGFMFDPNPEQPDGYMQGAAKAETLAAAGSQNPD